MSEQSALSRDAWMGLVPHQGRMALIGQVLAFDAGSIRCRSDDHRDPDHPLRRHGRLHAVHLCEYGAQAMAVHGALLARAGGGSAAPGLLVALRDVELACERIDDLPGPLDIRAWRAGADTAAWLYRFEVLHDGVRLAAGQAMVKLEDRDGH
jgi:predicted hotdog family 3-hydroxylacyl-ACP dehydratase